MDLLSAGVQSRLAQMALGVGQTHFRQKPERSTEHKADASGIVMSFERFTIRAGLFPKPAMVDGDLAGQPRAKKRKTFRWVTVMRTGTTVRYKLGPVRINKV